MARAPGRFLLALSLPLALPLAAQDGGAPSTEENASGRGEKRGQKPVIVTATRDERDPFEVPYSVFFVSQDVLRERSYRTMPQVLRDVPSALVQETSPGQGSPYLRGFTGYANLLLIDGVRLNNSAFRSGPNQYWNTIDPLGIERMEVVLGPGSTLYGSDAIGGTVQVFTKSPAARGKPGISAEGATMVRYSSAENSIMGRGEISVSESRADGSRTGVLLGGDAKAFGDVIGGADTGTQTGTGYEETAFDVKIEHWLSGQEKLVFLHQELDQNDVPRTHNTSAAVSFRGTSTGSDQRRDLDENRSLTYLQYRREDRGSPIESLSASVSWQQIGEEQDRIRSSGSETFEGFSVGTLGAFVQCESRPTAAGTFLFGAEFYRDHVDSWLRRAGAAQPSDWIQGPLADNARYDMLGVYVQDRIALGDRAEILLGGRYTHAAADADKVRDPVTSGPFAIDEQWDQLTGSVRMRFDLLEDRWNVFAGASQGFRAPSLSDLSSFQTARSGEFEVPAADLEPEHYTGYEVGTKVRTERLTAEAAWFYTDISDLVQRFPTGNTNASGEAEVTKANIGEGSVQGVELMSSLSPIDDCTLFAAGSWQYSRIENYQTLGSALSYEPLSRTMPLTIRAGARYEPFDRGFFVEAEVVHAEKQDRLSSGDRRDTQRIPPGGTPGYTLLHLRAGATIGEHMTIDVALENATDYDYRVHGSGTNSPGRSLVVGMTTRF
ncbi:MAG: TonB-dependent receptor [Planctomycetota bacterium]